MVRAAVVLLSLGLIAIAGCGRTRADGVGSRLEPSDGGGPGKKPPAMCPQSPFGDQACASEGATCAYGRECCCGECHDAVSCRCDGGKWSCHYTDACLGAAIKCPDAGPVEPDAGPTNHCAVPSSGFSMWAARPGSPNGPDRALDLDLHGIARARGRNPISLVFDSGEEVEIHFAPDAPFQLPEAERFEVQLYTRFPWWSEVAVAFRRLRDRRTELVAAAWSHPGTEVAVRLPELLPSYRNSGCAAERTDCGMIQTRTLVVRQGNAVAEVPAGESRTLLGFGVQNAQSFGFTEDPWCSDTPRDWIAGHAVRLR